MKEEQHRFLAIRGELPARLTAEQTAWVLNCQQHDVPILVAARLLKPLGNPAANGTKYFASSDIAELAKDRSWLVKMTNALNQYWQRKNARKKCNVLNTVDAPSAAKAPDFPVSENSGN